MHSVENWLWKRLWVWHERLRGGDCGHDDDDDDDDDDDKQEAIREL